MESKSKWPKSEIPVVADSFGAWSKESTDVFDSILKRDPERNELSFSLRKNFLYSKLSMSIQRSNARSILNKQQQLKNFNFSHRNDNYTPKSSNRSSPTKCNLKKSSNSNPINPNKSLILANKVRNFLISNNPNAKIRSRRNPYDSFIEKFIIVVED